ncbi:unannotated protein [freshwater metagenome]|uniref:Unannotated protein n=1 Tax=freshwater metagenome TaxID=449393 RepID=A0A6J7JGJ6_9ZZZZ
MFLGDVFYALIALSYPRASKLNDMNSMKRQTISIFAIVILTFSFINQTQASDEYPPASVGSGFSEPYSTPEWSLSAIRGYKPLAPGKIGQGEHPLCASAKDAHCADSTSLLADLVVPPCYSPTDRFCIEGLEMSIEGSPVVAGSLLRELKTASTPADAASGLPKGGSASIWTTPTIHQGGSNNYAVVVTGGYSKSKEQSQFDAFRFSASVYPVTLKSGTYCPYEIYEVIDQFGEANTSSRLVGNNCSNTTFADKCILTETGTCVVPAEFAPNTRVSLSLRMDNKVTGWLFGRMKDVDMKSTALDNKNNLLRVEATSLNLMSAKAWVTKKEAPNYKLLWEDISTKWFLTKAAFDEWVASPYTQWGDMIPVGSFKQFAMWEPLLKPEAKDNWRWNFAASNNNIANSPKCLDESGRANIVGLVTTNAPIYDGGAPRFNDGFLDYKLAGLHNKADGSLFIGSYDLVIRSTFARCLYGFTSAPLQATVSVMSADGTTSNVATEVVQERDGWISLEARNFTFSTPTARVKFSQTATATNKGPTSNEVKNPVTAKKITITCTKGKLIKKISAVNPKCPAGYKKK